MIVGKLGRTLAHLAYAEHAITTREYLGWLAAERQYWRDLERTYFLCLGAPPPTKILTGIR